MAFINTVFSNERFGDDLDLGSPTMNNSDVILTRQAYNTRFKNGDMDFAFNWAVGISQVLGLSTSQIFRALRDVSDGDPDGWRAGFTRQAGDLIAQANTLLAEGHVVAAGQAWLGAAYAHRAALQFTSPRSRMYAEAAHEMERAFQTGVACLGVPVRAMAVPFAATTLPGYFLEHDDSPRPVVVMIGGGDTFREDLFYFAGYPGWKRGYNVLMVDLPGQGLLPDSGLTFQVDSAAPIRAALDWLEAHAAARPAQIAIYGVSGGGYFTAQAVVADKRINAWIAATPILDMQAVFTREFGRALAAPGWALNTLMRLVGSINAVAAVNLDKYAWQFGTADFKSAAQGVLDQAEVVDCSSVSIPTLLLLSDGEGPELRRQTLALYEDFKRRGVNVTLREFTDAEGADGHCQLNNLRLTHTVVFDWLDRVFDHDSGDVRLRC